VAQLTCFGLLHLENMQKIPRSGETEKRTRVKHHCNRLGCALLHCTVVNNQRYRQKKNPNTNQVTPFMWKGCYGTFRAKPALPCLADVNNTHTQNNLDGNIAFAHSHPTDLIHLSLGSENVGRATHFLKRATSKKHLPW